MDMEGLNTCCGPATWIFSTKHLQASVQVLDNKLDDLCARISFQRDIRNCNVLCFTETWLSPGIPESAIQPGERHCVPGHGHWHARHGGLSDDAVLFPLLLLVLEKQEKIMFTYFIIQSYLI